jgi:hypothetical protein
MTQRWYRDLGNGPVCPESDEHGHLYEIDGMYWCPVTQHLFAIVAGGAGERMARQEMATDERSGDGHRPR